MGTGTGSLARLFALAGAEVSEVDPPPPLRGRAREIDRAAGVAVDHRIGTAEDTGLPDRSFHVVPAVQCWHWFDAPKATAEIRRLLRPGGRVVIAHFDWLPLPGNLVAATEQLITAYNPAWSMGGGTGLYPRWPTDLATASFTGIETFSFDLDVPYTQPGGPAASGQVPVSARACPTTRYGASATTSTASSPTAFPVRSSVFPTALRPWDW
ncbi:class I SAM-dependent methyltransferase (plasmid) [Streptomyces sp. HU2014]|uniref:class I SAM-dependent methyltransferase n=1 Tax=Streptomyces sp. HU2014 TaxID=2939414 RepID=UPI00200DF0EC|nr:class I SAM-dependent methyltransferase [Streptomyces sp. HU2014]UQI49753.1 class I SAM-dependent methyltransferase [Streptomyces sp. HU2014]